MATGTQRIDSDRLARPTYVPAVDGLRGVAVTWIAVMHCWNALGERMPIDGGPLRYLVASGYFGLDLLFIVSGFVLFLPAVYAGNVGDWRDYTRRRAARIVPGFWVAVVLTYFVAERVGEAVGGFGAWLSHVTFLHQYAHEVSDVGFGTNRAMWTMSVEVVFYALLPFVASAFNRHPFVGLGLAIGISQAWHLLVLNLPSVLGWAGVSWAGAEDAQFRMAYVFPSYVAHFAIGMTAAWLFVHFREIRQKALSPHLLSAVAWSALIGLLAVTFLRGRQRVNGELGPFDPRIRTLDRTVLLGVLVLAAALGAVQLQGFLGNRVSRALGRWSYGIYLSHMLLIVLLRPWLGLEKGTTSNMDLLVLVAAVVPLAIATGAASYHYLETPFRRLARRPRREEPVSRPVRPVALASSSA
jgi:peptidoglycan/LPS O-acetylase OafA/YrhL